MPEKRVFFKPPPRGAQGEGRNSGGDYLQRRQRSLGRLPYGGKADPRRVARGRALAEQHYCPVCHNPDYSGREQMPRLVNQREDYLLKALRDYKSGRRVPYGRGMEEVVAILEEGDLADLAHYLAYLPPR